MTKTVESIESQTIYITIYNKCRKISSHPDEEMIIKVDENSTHATLWSLEIIKTQFEWVFLNITIDQKVVDFYGSNQTSIIYTVSSSIVNLTT